MIDGEPRFGPWQVHRVEDILAELLPAPGPPRILAVDGRSGSGKTTAAERMAGGVPGSAVVHTDDIVWNHAMFDWAELITEGVLGPVRRGEAVTFRPPAWNAPRPRGRRRRSGRLSAARRRGCGHRPA